MLSFLAVVWKKHSVVPADNRNVNSMFWFDSKPKVKPAVRKHASKQRSADTFIILSPQRIVHLFHFHQLSNLLLCYTNTIKQFYLYICNCLLSYSGGWKIA